MEDAWTADADEDVATRRRIGLQNHVGYLDVHEDLRVEDPVVKIDEIVEISAHGGDVVHADQDAHLFLRR